MAKPTLTYEDYQKAAKRLNCEVAAIRAVADVESSGDGFDTFGRLKQRFESAWFRRYTNQTVSTYSQAYQIDPKSAMLSTSWGKFQIMGFNHSIAGFSSVDAMVEAFNQNEQAQLGGFVNFIIAKKLTDELQRKDWNGFAYTYNGSDYARLGYHTKMAKAYAKYAADPSAGLDKKKVQTASSS